LISSPFGGTVYLVKLKQPNALGIRSYFDIAAVPEVVDLAVIVTPAPTVPHLIRDCVKARVKGAIIISAGFKEIGPEGVKLEQEVLEQAQQGQMRLIGPNRLGVMRPHGGLNATFAAQITWPGTVGFLSQILSCSSFTPRPSRTKPTSVVCSLTWPMTRPCVMPIVTSNPQFARLLAHGSEVCDIDIPRLAIRPYLTHYMTPWTANNGTLLVIRPIRPEDEPSLVKFHGTLSDRTVALRYFHVMTRSTRVAHERLTWICFIDYDREMALVAQFQDPQTGNRDIIGVSRLNKIRGTNEAEFVLLASDRFQHKSIGAILLERLIEVGCDEQLNRITGDILPENHDMQHFSEELGFWLTQTGGSPVMRAIIDI
jgi:RimJ/RimL family protein N-acetyltransferase